MLALRAGNGKSKKAKLMTPAQRAVADRLASKAKRIVGYPTRAI